MKTATEFYWEKPEAPRSPVSIKRILVPISSREPSSANVEFAVRLARADIRRYQMTQLSHPTCDRYGHVIVPNETPVAKKGEPCAPAA